ncbi:AEC family transporter [Ponticoccus alexandrii]|uniref:AEC family transporter n=1 Tax=Ponticoccus alexandrii TaxID=1943633 RepID=A0ABX7FCM4_9RHOB|nr:AEC family transporter [Ponticoccus alexandrii]ETA50416.1 malonate transporter [Rhodobacteraceae bacterium PD-2]QRF67122.1 AEC family transporter [Ponticoccus alexandrii]
MQGLIDVILPVFLVIGAGYLAVWRRIVSDAAVDGIMSYATGFAVPCLLFRAISNLHLEEAFDPWILVSFYTGSIAAFAAGLLGARYAFARSWEDSVAIGFCCLFANSLLMGLAITERAYGPDALQANYLIVSIHAPLCYAIGITAMELVRAKASGASLRSLPAKVGRAIFRNALVIGILLGALANLVGLSLPGPVAEALDMVVRTALPVALFAIGGVLCRYKPEGDTRLIAMVCVISLLMHPAITWGMGSLTGISTEAFRSAVLTASMAPGVNAYVFANMYGTAKRVAATSVLVATGLSVATAWLWLTLLP